jgi:hypothetical protein
MPTAPSTPRFFEKFGIDRVMVQADIFGFLCRKITPKRLWVHSGAYFTNVNNTI